MKKSILLCLIAIPLSLQAQVEEDFDLDSLGLYDDSQADIDDPSPIGLLSLLEAANLRISIGGNLVKNEGENMKIQYFRSGHTEIAILSSPHFFKKRVALKIGSAVGWQTYRFQKNVYLSYTDPSTEILPTTELDISNDQLKSSSFRTFYLGIPVEIVVYPFPRKKRSLSITVGGYANYILSTRSKIRYTIDGKNYRDERSKPFAIEKFQYGLNFRVGYGRFLSLYYRIGLSPIFSGTDSPLNEDKTTISSIGITLGGN